MRPMWPRHVFNSDFLDGLEIEDAKRKLRHDSRIWGWASAPPPTGCGTGASHASAIGAVRSRSSTARHVVPFRFPRISFRSHCRRMSTSTSPATRSRGIRLGNTRRAPNVAATPSVRRIRSTPSSKAPGTLRASATHRPNRLSTGQDRLLDAGRPVYRRRRARGPAPALRPLLHPRPDGCGYLSATEPFAGLVTQGMVCHETYQGPDGKWLYPNITKTDDGSWVTIDGGQPVKVGRVEKMSKSKRNTVDPERSSQLRRGYGPSFHAR